MAKKNKPGELGRKLSELEAILGSQKKAAEKLGINVSTYRAAKTGKANLSKEKLSRANRVYGQNKRKLEEAPIREKVERREKQTERKRAAREIQRKRENITYESTVSWIRKQYGGEGYENYIIRALESVSMYVAYDRSNPESVQFTDGIETVGKPKGKKFVTVWGLYTLSYIVEAGQAEAGNSDLKDVRIPLLIDLDKEWDLQTTLDYLESKFMDTAYQTGRRKFIPSKFIGYQL